jgi:Clp amino terminal domain, pathogenicity island component
MPKINVYLPDDLADAVRDSGIPVSAICQRALEQAVRRVTAIREAVVADLSDADLAARLPSFTPRAIHVLSLARNAGGSLTGTGHLLGGILTEGSNLAIQVLRSMEIDPGRLTGAPADEPGDNGFSTSAINALELTVAEATALGHNYVGCEHLLIGLAAEPDGAAGRVLREAGADVKAVRRAVSAALAGYSHLRAQTTPQPSAIAELLRKELAPLIARIEALEKRAS